MNVTPLVDVVLVLLIIFMVVAPRMEQDVPVELPGIFNPDPEVEATTDPIKVSVPRAGEFHIDDQHYDLDGAIQVLSGRHAEEPLRRLALRADAKLSYGQVREILARTQQVGFPGVSLLVGERTRKGARREKAAGNTTPGEPNALDAAAAEGAGQR
ncbi:MAG: biopolymer transporter ExbD [Thermodesulfobacteriota bacterium]